MTWAEDNPTRVADVTDLAADLAAAYGATPEEAGRAIAASFGWPYQPEASYGIIIRFRWWERPRRLWAQKAKTRTLEDLDLPIGEDQ